MPTVIDSLVVELGLDPKNFTKGQREALDAFKKTQEEAVKGGKSIEEQSKKSLGALGGIKTQALELFAVFKGGKIGKISPLIADFRALSAAGGTIIDINKGVDQTLLDISANLAKVNAAD